MELDINPARSQVDAAAVLAPSTSSPVTLDVGRLRP
jgi:hypothetical protein